MSRNTAPLAACQAVARALGWATSIAAMVVMGFIANRWPGKIGSVAGGMIGISIAILNDSWQMVSVTNRAMGFQALTPARAMLHDVVSLAISLGGLVLIIFTGASSTGKKDDDDDRDLQYSSSLDHAHYGVAFTLPSLMNAAHWFLVGVILWRFLFAVWGCYDCVQIATPEQQRLRYRRQMEEAQTYDA
ncbi:hypothetical protein V2A60_007167 [Cordyceps javanica]|uniref:Uncharacterized protein n=1 Tax=Cordyceps javanica TaxID=43265 RepID=A0A545VRB6_9HYPO|nr:hypothetical protein IF1G_08999 [Cordyceps javanica]TQW04280.1 hypothetical protein IF2G_08050 [Cordyceps javanica]